MGLRGLAREGQNFLERLVGITEFLCFKVMIKKGVKAGQRAGEGIR